MKTATVSEQRYNFGRLSMNRSAEHRLGSLDEIAGRLAEAVLGAPIVRFMGVSRSEWNTGLSIEPS